MGLVRRITVFLSFVIASLLISRLTRFYPRIIISGDLVLRMEIVHCLIEERVTSVYVFLYISISLHLYQRCGSLWLYFRQNFT